MTVTLTFCDKCGAIIPKGTTPARMVLDGKEYDLCATCHQELTGGLQSAGRPTTPDTPTVTIYPPAEQPKGLPNPAVSPGITISPDYSPVNTDQPWTWVTTKTWNPGTYHYSPTLMMAISNAAGSIGQALASSNAMTFAAHD